MFIRSPIRLGTLCCTLFICSVVYIGLLVNSYYKKQAKQELTHTLTQYNHQLKSKLSYLGHRLYAIDAFIKNDENHELIYQVAQTQLANSNIPLSLERYHIIEGYQAPLVEKKHQQLGAFDFKVRLPAQQSKYYLTVVQAAPVAEYGHLVGLSKVMRDQQVVDLYSLNKLQVINWPDNNKWSLLIQRPSSHGFLSALGLSFQLPLLFEGLFDQVYGNSQQHLTVHLNNQQLYSTDWKNTYQLSQVAPGVSDSIDFYGLPLTVALYSQTQLNPSILGNRQITISMFVLVASLCGILLLLYVRNLATRNQVVNDIVIERTTSLALANKQLSRESEKRLGALQQQISAERKYKSLFINSNEALFVLNQQGIIIDANPSFLNLILGHSEIDAKQTLETFIVDESFVKQWQQIVLDRHNHEQLEWLAQVYSGDMLWLRQTGGWLHQPDGVFYEGRIIDITQAKLFNEQLKYSAQHDGLTDLLNRETFLNNIELKRTKSSGCHLLLYIDLDRFKLINDTLGHIAGDKLLVEFSARMRLLLANIADIARLGGDEFAILIEEQNLVEIDLEGLLAQMLDEFRKPFLLANQNHSVSCSIGVRRFTTPCLDYDAEKLLHDADIAMYEAKKRGKNGFHIYTSKIACQASRRLQIERALHDLNEEQELELYFQPIYCQFGKELRGFEALLRWNSPILGRVGPAEFIPIAEECAKISMLGEWVFLKAMQFMKTHSHVNGGQLFMSVNVSPFQVQNLMFVKWLKSKFLNTRLCPSLFKIELTESAMMSKEDTLVRPLERLHKLGFGIYIDDFGTGYSSLARLNTLPVDGLKIDRAFIEGIDNTGKERQLIEAICAIAKSFNLEVTAEGIETKAQLTVLEQLHCHQSQGYFMNKPMSFEQASELVKRAQYNSHIPLEITLN